jgi:hypothetical protein
MLRCGLLRDTAENDLSKMSTGGEVANALVCKTSIRGFNSLPVLQHSLSTPSSYARKNSFLDETVDGCPRVRLSVHGAPVQLLRGPIFNTDIPKGDLWCKFG